MSNVCINFQDIDSDLGCGDNQGGIVKVLMFFHKDVDVWPTAPTLSPSSTLGDYAKLSGDLVFKTDKCAKSFFLPQNKGSFQITELGEMGGMSHQMELSLYQYGLTAEMLGFMGVTKNAKLGFIVIDSNGNAFLMGDKDTGANREKGDGATTGSARTDLPGTTLKFVYPVNNPRLYVGDLTAVLVPAP
jgi:hypothetical protein